MKKKIIIFLLLIPFIGIAQPMRALIIKKASSIVITPPAIISDGNTVAWYIADDLSTITKDGGTNEVSVWADKLGSGHNLLQSTSTRLPIWSSAGITFDGSNDYMQTATFIYNQPESIWIVFKQISWSTDDIMIDGFTTNKMLFRQRTATPGLAVYAGTYSTVSNDLAVGNFGIVRIVFNGASSRLVVNENTAITGNWGTAQSAGITIGASPAPANYANVIIKEIIFRNVAYNSTDDTLIYNYLKTKYSL